MPKVRGMRKEDKTAEVVALTLENSAQVVLRQFCRQIEELPEIKKLKRETSISTSDWLQFIATLARKALSGESVESTMHAFNRLYVFRGRKKHS